MSRLYPSGLSAPMLRMMAGEFGCTGRFEMSSFHGLSGGKICIALRMLSASGVSKSTGIVSRSAASLTANNDIARARVIDLLTTHLLSQPLGHHEPHYNLRRCAR
jgi:hypothetical protein